MKVKFKKDKEYIFLNKLGKYVRILVEKVSVVTIEGIEYQSVKSKCLVTNWEFNFVTNDFQVKDIFEPITCTEFFIMYTNWNNFNREGFHQDIQYADELKQKIITTLSERSIVKKGSSKFEDYDYRLLIKLLGHDNLHFLNLELNQW